MWTTATGAPINDGNLRRRVLEPVVEDLGMPWVGFHTVRDTCASLLFASGKNIKTVQARMGHADPGFTLRTCVHLMDEGLGSATSWTRRSLRRL